MSQNKKLKPDKLREYPWPDCAKVCSAIEYFGASECDSICGWRDFDKEYQAKSKIDQPS